MRRLLKRNTYRVGVAGLTDVYRIAYTLATYFASYERKTTALIEVCDSGPMRGFNELRTEDVVPVRGTVGFRRDGITFFEDVPPGLAEVSSGMDYERIVYICPELMGDVHTIFRTCDKRILIGDLTVLGKQDYANYLTEYGIRRQWIQQGECYVTYGSSTNMLEMQEALSYDLKLFPYLHDPTELYDTEILSIQELLYGERKKRHRLIHHRKVCCRRPK